MATDKPLVRAVEQRAELEQILALQQANLASHLSAEEFHSQGFVTAVHTLQVLEQMHALAPSIVAKAGAAVVSYALTMLVEARRSVPILEPMFELLETLSFRGRPLAASRFYVMGQVCIARAYRGQGLFDALYQGHQAQYGERYQLLVTEISLRNPRSLRGSVGRARHRDAFSGRGDSGAATG